MKIISGMCVSFGLALLSMLARGQQKTNPGFISVDCGAPSDSFDPYTSIYYTTDANYVSTGVNMQVGVPYKLTYYQDRYKTLRSFPNGTRNCYTLKPQNGKNNRYLIRTMFWYGNYDGNDKVPMFDLYVDVNLWFRVNITFSYEEIIYMAPRDEIQLCLVNVGLGTPFISVIELRLLDNSTYNINSGALIGFGHWNMGGNSTSIRHPQDEYDRIWSPLTYDYMNISNNAVDLKTFNDAYKVPSEVLMTASLSVDQVEDPISLVLHSIKPESIWYIYFHFAEIQNIPESLLIREFTINLNDLVFTTVNLQYGKPFTVVSPPLTGSNVTFGLYETARSDLLPILNAVEYFYLLDLPVSPSALDDVTAINGIKRIYEVTRDSWQGDPCVPRHLSWNGLNCSYDNPPRIVSLNLSSSNLAGEIASSLSNLSKLTSLDLSHNQLRGNIPEFFAQMPNLKYLNLSGNNLSGSVPKALKIKQSAGTLQASFDGNPNLCQSDSCTATNPTKKHINLIIPVVGASAAVLLAVLLGIITFFTIKRRRNGVTNSTNTGSSSGLKNEASPRVAGSKKQTLFTCSEVSEITENFRLVIGEGGFGKVYLGTLQDGTKVAVKLETKGSEQHLREFDAEVELLMIVHHRNLVCLKGWCDEMENRALVYEFMSNGNLRQHLSEYNTNVLSWSQRLQIAVDAAQGLEYLHNGCKPPIVHRDLKTTNILLNENMQAKIADFGLSKAFESDNESHISTRPAGTPGYLDPEFHASGNLTKKSDLYSFGIILLELISGQPAIIRNPKGSTHLLQWVAPLIQRGDIESIVDPRLDGQFNPGSAWKALEIAMSCVPLYAMQRPDMSHVLSELKECLGISVASRATSQITTPNSNVRSQSFEITSTEFDVAPRAR